MSIIVLVSTLARSNTMAPTDSIDRALTSVGLKSTCGPDILTSYWVDLVIYMLLIVEHFPFLDTNATGVRLLASCFCRCATCLLISDTVHSWGCPLFPFPIDSPLKPFSSVAKSILTKKPPRSCKELWWWLGRSFHQRITGYIGGKRGWVLCLCLPDNILMDAIRRRRWYRSGMQWPVVLLCLLGISRCDSRGWRLVWGGLKREQNLCAHRL